MQAQYKRNYIYVVDCTKSMRGYNGAPDIWERTKQQLHDAVSRQSSDKDATFAIIPFQDKSLATVTFQAGSDEWKTTEKSIDGYSQRVTRTNIVDAFKKALTLCDTRRQNYIYLYTDGKDNVGGTPAVVNAINAWCGTHEREELMYVMLTEGAVSDEIKQAIDACPHAHAVSPSEVGVAPDIVCLDTHTIEANTRELDTPHPLTGNMYEGTLEIVSNDPYFTVTCPGPIKNYVANLQIRPRDSQALERLRRDHPDEAAPYEFTFKANVKGALTLNPDITVYMTRMPQRSLRLCDNRSDEVSLEDAHWYPSFLWTDAASDPSGRLDLKALFNAEARKTRARALMCLSGDKDEDGLYEAYYNGKKIEDGTFVIDSRDKESVLELRLKPEAATGDRHWTLACQKLTNIDVVNGSRRAFTLPVRMHYSRRMNPLARTLMWIGIALAIALVVWFAFLKRMFFPPFKPARITFSGKNLYSSHKIKGCRKAVFSNKTMRQGMFSKIFTGKILYARNEIWTSPWTLEPGSRGSVRAVTGRQYTVEPGRNIRKNTEASIYNEATNDKYVIEVK